MPTNTLTDSRCKAARPAEKDYKLFDGGGLYLFVSAKGAKTWRLAYRIGGKPKTISFGPYPEIGLAEAREKRDEVKAQLRDGDDPMGARRTKRHAKSKTLAQCNEEYWDGRNDLSSSYRTNAVNGIKTHLYPRLGERAIGDITREDLLESLNIMDRAGLHVYVRKVRMWVGQVFDWAIEQQLAEINPALLINPKKAFGRAEVEHFAALEPKDMAGFQDRLSIEPEIQSVLALKLLAYTWTRTIELRMMEWSEIDFDERLWLIPAGKMKRKKDHLVPLSDQAIKILNEMKSRSRGSAYVFQNDRTIQRPMSENAVLYLIYRLGYKGRMTGHGFRSVASTWANTAGYNPDVIERQLAHVPENKVRSAYNRAAYLPERRQLLQDWANWLESQVNAGRHQG